MKTQGILERFIQSTKVSEMEKSQEALGEKGDLSRKSGDTLNTTPTSSFIAFHNTSYYGLVRVIFRAFFTFSRVCSPLSGEHIGCLQNFLIDRKESSWYR
jgi:hypothetical protein